MSVKEKLKALRFTSKIIDSKIRQLYKLKRQIQTVQSFDYSKERFKTNEKTSFENTLCKIIDLEREITKDIDKLADGKKELDNFVKSVLSGNEYLVIQMRYFEETNWLDIAKRLNYTLDNIYKIHGKALLRLNKNFTVNYSKNSL